MFYSVFRFSCADTMYIQVVEPSTGMPFPGALNEVQLFTGTGLRKKSILGLKKITVYAYGKWFSHLLKVKWLFINMSGEPSSAAGLGKILSFECEVIAYI